MEFCDILLHKHLQELKKDGGMNLKEREVKYDYLRVFAVLAIIMVHAIPTEAANWKQWLFSAALQPVLLSFVGIYFMLSGLFLLRSGTENILEFYWKRFETIVIPFVFYCGIYYWYYKIYLGKEEMGPGEHLLAFAKGLLEGTVPMASHIWFMYVIMGLYLCTPFLARMVNAMKDAELRLFFIIMLSAQAAVTYLPALGLQVGEALQYVIFKGWLIYFILGYALKRLYGRKNAKGFKLLGLAGFGITMLQKCFVPSFQPGIHDMALPMFAMSAGIFMSFESLRRAGERGRINRAAGFISRHSYSVYLIHYLVLGQAAQKLVEQTQLRHYYVPKIISVTGLTFLLSLTGAWLLDETAVRLLKKIAAEVRQWFAGKRRREDGRKK